MPENLLSETTTKKIRDTNYCFRITNHLFCIFHATPNKPDERLTSNFSYATLYKKKTACFGTTFRLSALFRRIGRI